MELSLICHFLKCLTYEDLSTKEDSQFHLIMTVAKEFAECVLCILMEKLPDRPDR
jgi:hypothetical protein